MGCDGTLAVSDIQQTQKAARKQRAIRSETSGSSNAASTKSSRAGAAVGNQATLLSSTGAPGPFFFIDSIAFCALAFDL